MAQAPPDRLPFFGARISLYPMTDRYVPVILTAVDGLRGSGLEIETDDVSTFLGGDRNSIWSALERVFAQAARTGEHVVMTALISPDRVNTRGGKQVATFSHLPHLPRQGRCRGRERPQGGTP